MGNINLNKKQLLEVKNIVSIMKQDGMDYDLFKAFYSYIAPKLYGEPMFRDGITERGTRRMAFYPQHDAIIGAYSFLEKWSDRNADCFDDFSEIKDKELFKMYLKLYALSHEVEHGYQKGIAAGVVNCGTHEVTEGYKTILDLFSKDDSILPHPIRDMRRHISLLAYKKNENLFVLERNANVDSYEFIAQLASAMGDEEIYKGFDMARRTFLKAGYIEDNMGSFYETYKKTFMLDKYKKIFGNQSYLELLDDYEKVRLGLPVLEEVRQDVLKLRF
jgi:hypothetical protein